MKSNVFVRPNLKAFILGGVLLVVVQHFMNEGYSQGQWLPKPLSAQARAAGEDDLRELIRLAAESPSADVYLRLSHCFEKKGDYRKALHFMRQAEKLDSVEDLN